jgi:hypothetical protein
MLLPIASKRVAATKGIGPRDVLEGMIAAQMLACHDAAMLCFRHAVDSKWGSHLRREHLNQAGKRYSAIDEDELSAKQGRSFRRVQRFPFP